MRWQAQGLNIHHARFKVKEVAKKEFARLEITKEKIYRKSLLDESKWKNFVNSMNNILPEIQDDLEMVSTFYYFSEKLNTSHFAFLKSIETAFVVLKS